MIIRSEPPKDDFLKKVRKLVSKRELFLSLMNALPVSESLLEACIKIFQLNLIWLYLESFRNGYSITAIVGKEILWKHSE